MNLLITAGNTQAPIDRVRCVTNIFTGRTGAAIALAACERGHQVTLLTSQPETVPTAPPPDLYVYRTFDDLARLMTEHIASGQYDTVIHTAAVSDYLCTGVYAPAEGTRFLHDKGVWLGSAVPPLTDRDAGSLHFQRSPRLIDRSAGKVKSDDPELWLRLTRAPKLVDRIRADWNFRGKLVKFKLEVGLTDEELLDVAERSRLQSQADWMVANTLDDAARWAFLGPWPDGYHKITRSELPAKLLDALERSMG